MTIADELREKLLEFAFHYKLGDEDRRAVDVEDALEALRPEPAPDVVDLAVVLAEIEQEWRWGNLTKLGVANHLRRKGFRQEAAIRHAETLAASHSALSQSHDMAGLVEALRFIIADWGRRREVLNVQPTYKTKWIEQRVTALRKLGGQP